MVRFAANLTYLFTELPMLARLAAARRAGFTGAEILFPYDLPVKDLTRAATAAGLPIVLINAPPPNWAGGARGFAAEPDNEARFRVDFDRALRFARALGVQNMHVMAGRASGPEAHRTFVANLIWATARAPDLTLTIKPMNTGDIPGYFLHDFDLAGDVIAEVGADNLGLQFDAYQAQVIHGDVLGLWQRHGAITRHVQIAGYPGGHEPLPGVIDFLALYKAIAEMGYDGWIGAEYFPATRTSAGLGWLRGL